MSGEAAEARDVSVAVPVKDRRGRMLRCLAALLDQDHPSYEVIVLDNGSRDGTPDACRKLAETADVPVRVEVIEGTVGQLRNRVRELATGDVVAFTDSDCMPTPGWLSAGVAALRADPRVGIVQGKTLPEPGSEQRPWPATLSVTEFSGRFESCNLFVAMQAFRESDGFDEVVGHFWEDTAAGWAVMRAGWRAGFAPDAVVYHDVTYPGLGWHLRRAQRYGNAAHVVKRYPELRKDLLWARYFLRPRNAAVAAAVAGIAFAPLAGRASVAAALPYAWMRRPRVLNARGALDQLEVAAFDIAILVGMLRGSLRYRALVL